MRRVGLLVGGGECPGINAILKNFIIKCKLHDIEVIGFNDGWKGLLQDEGTFFNIQEVEETGLLAEPLLTALRFNLTATETNYDTVKQVMQKHQLEALCIVGGDDTLRIADKLQRHNINVVGIPKTIDNDLSGTDSTFGFYTASNVATDALDKLQNHAKRTGLCFVVEVMGNSTGWLAIQAGIAAGAHLVLIPEFPKTLEEITEVVSYRHKQGKHTLICLAEGFELLNQDKIIQEETIAKDVYGNIKMYQKEIGTKLAKIIQQETGVITRATVLGHLLRGGTPTAADRTLGTKFGVAAADLMIEKDYGYMIGLQGSQMIPVSLQEAIQKKYVDEALYHASGYHRISW